MVALVLLPGMDGTGDLFAAFAGHFAACMPQVEVVVASYPTEGAQGYGELEAVARTFLPQGRPYFVLGESFSGPIAISIAAAPPPGLQGLILGCSFARNPQPWLAPARPLMPLLPVKAMPLWLLERLVLGRYTTPALRSALAAALARVSAQALRSRAKAVLAVDASEKLARVRVPTLYLRATEDRVVPVSAARRVGALRPETRIVELAGPHFLLQTRPAEAAQAVAAFMAQVETPALRG